jgi:hypothetical protein
LTITGTGQFRAFVLKNPQLKFFPAFSGMSKSGFKTLYIEGNRDQHSRI